MGYAMVFGPCVCCDRTFGMNPVRVPSIRINGVKEPICKDCIPRVNAMRRAKGTEEIVPHPEAYQSCDENELP